MSLEPPQISAYKLRETSQRTTFPGVSTRVSLPREVDTGGAVTLTLWERGINWVEEWKKTLPQQGVVSKFIGQNKGSSGKSSTGSSELAPLSDSNKKSGKSPHTPKPSSRPAASYNSSAIGLKAPKDIVFQHTQPEGSSSKAPYQTEITPPTGGKTRPYNIYGDLPSFSLAGNATASTNVSSTRNGLATPWAPASPASENISNLAPPVFNDPMKSPSKYHELNNTETKPVNTSKSFSTTTQQLETGYYDVNKPTCSLNLVCYRTGSDGCVLQQIHCTLPSKFSNEENFTQAITDYPNLVYSDVDFFHEMRRLYQTKMSNMFRRVFSLKSLRAFKILAHTPTTRPIVVPFDDFVLQEMMYAYRNPDRLESKDDWVRWVFRLRRKDKRHAVEFVEGWNTTRIAIAGSIPWLSSCLVAITWTAAGGDPQTTFTVASFILTSSSVVLALLAIISSIESSGRTKM